MGVFGSLPVELCALPRSVRSGALFEEIRTLGRSPTKRANRSISPARRIAWASI